MEMRGRKGKEVRGRDGNSTILSRFNTVRKHNSGKNKVVALQNKIERCAYQKRKTKSCFRMQQGTFDDKVSQPVRRRVL